MDRVREKVGTKEREVGYLGDIEDERKKFEGLLMHLKSRVKCRIFPCKIGMLRERQRERLRKNDTVQNMMREK